MSQRVLTVAIFHEPSGWSLPEELVVPLREAVPPGMAVRTASSRGALVEALPETEYLIGLPLSESQLATTAHGLQWIQLCTSQEESLAPVHLALERGVRVCGAARARAPQAAEHAVGMLLSLTRRLAEAGRMQEDHRWGSADLAGGVRELSGSTVALLGAGPIAWATASLLRAFGCELLGLDSGTGADADAEGAVGVLDRTFPVSGLDEFLSRADAVIVTGDAAPEAFLGKAQLAALRRDAFFVDAGAPWRVDHEALLHALRKGAIAGAALDAFPSEPLSIDAPYWTMRNVLVSPRLAPASPGYWSRAVGIAAQNLVRIESGAPLLEELTAAAVQA